MSRLSAIRNDDLITAQGVKLHSGRVAFAHVPGRHGVVILIHGNSSCRGVFDAQADALIAAGHAVLAPDLPGHGASDDAADPETTYSFPGYAAAIGELMDRLGLEEAHLVGWSLGGHVAIELAAGDRRIRSVFVTGTPPVRPGAEALRDAFAETPEMTLAGKERFDRRDAGAYAAAMLGCEPSAVPETLRDAALRTDGRARRYMIRNGVAGVGTDQRAFAAAPTVPLAVVQGRRDPFLKTSYLDALPAAALWRGGVQWFDDLGHAPHWEAPARFNATLRAFLADVAAGSER